MEYLLFFFFVVFSLLLISSFFNCKYAYSLLHREKENTDLRRKLDAAAYTGSLAVKGVRLREWIQKAEMFNFSSVKLLVKMIVREALTFKLLPTTKNYFISHLLRIFHEVLHMWMHMVDDAGQKEAKHNYMITNSWQSMKSCYQVIKPGNQNLQMPQKGR